MSATANTTTAPDSLDELLTPPLTWRQMVWLRFRRHKMAIFGVAIFVLLIVYSFGGALVFTEEYADYNDTKIRLQPPSKAHPFGTDSIGRDILARTIYGGQISLIIGLSAVVIQVIVGVTVMVGVMVRVAVWVTVCVSVETGVGELVGVTVLVAVRVGDSVGVAVSVSLAVLLAEAVIVCVGVAVGVWEALAV